MKIAGLVNSNALRPLKVKVMKVLPAFNILIFVTLLIFGYSLSPVLGGENTSPVWSVTAHEVGASRPEVGRSLFDHLMFEPEQGFEIPFPILALFKKIEVKTGILSDLTGKSSIKTALIPIGRSLQRYAADPDFFKYPRAIFAFTKEAGKDVSTVFNVKDRLYIAYQEKAEALEIISYNEQAGRFEFQVINDYAKGKIPTLEYAERSVCIGCHQNHAPIFATAPWDESGANKTIAKRMANMGSHRYTVPVNSSFDVADLLDQSTDRANRIPLFQKIWSESCAVEGGLEFEVKCRAAILLSSLKFRLSNYAKSYLETDSALQAYRRNLVAAFEKKWPEGLLESSPDIPNRNLASVLKRKEVKLRDFLEPDGKHNPLTLRGFKKNWFTNRLNDPSLDQVLLGFSQFFTSNDLQNIDRSLLQLRDTMAMTKFAGFCSNKNKQGDQPVQKFLVYCALKDDKNTPLELTLSLTVDQSQITGGVVHRGMLEGKIPFFKLQLENNQDLVNGKTTDTYTFSLRQKGSGLSVEMRGGDILDDMSLTISGPFNNLDNKKIPVSVTRYATGDVLDAAFKSLIQNALQPDRSPEESPLIQKVFQRSLVMTALRSVLGNPDMSACCYQTASMPLPIVEGNE